MANEINDPRTGYELGTLMESYGIRAPSVGHLLKFIRDMEALVADKENTAYEKGFNNGLNTQLTTEY